MRFVIQCVRDARVTISEEEAAAAGTGTTTGEIQQGMLVLIGVNDSDTEETAQRMVRKMLKLRIFEDSEGKTNLDLAAVGGSLLLVSQFTLYADVRKGNRPSFVRAGDPAHAQALYQYITDLCRSQGYAVETGVFGAYMHVSMTNEGPFTLIMDSEELGY